MKIDTQTVDQGTTTGKAQISAKAPAQGDFGKVLKEAGPSDTKRPTVAQFMAETGASAKAAVDIIYKFNDWQLYMSGQSHIDLTTAQRQIAEEVGSGIRSSAQESSDNFAWIEPPEPEVPGSVVPRFHELSGEVTGISYVDGEGNRFVGTPLSTDKGSVEREALGYGVGKAGLDEFAKRLGAEDFATLDWATVAEAFPAGAVWNVLYGKD